MELIRIENLYKTYFLGEVDVPVLKGVSLAIEQGEMVALMGVSGSGKSTLMNILGLLDRPTSGHYRLNGQEVSRLSADKRAVLRNRNIGFVFQSFNLLARTRTIDNVRMPLTYSVPAWSNREERNRAEELLKRVGLAERFDHEPSQLSGGQQQRVAIARSLVNHPPILLADEPTGNLDSKTSVEILEMFRRLNLEEGITVILVTHDLGVAKHADRIIHIRDGLIAHDALPHPSGDVNGNGSAGPIANGADGNGAAGNGSLASGPASGNGHAAPAVERVAVATVAGVVPEAAAAAGQSAPSKAAVVKPQPQVARAKAPVTRKIPLRRGRVRLMPRTVGTAVTAIRRNFFRSGLTAFGIIIGIAAVITMMEIGKGSSKAMEQTMASMGANQLLVMPGTATSGGVSFGSGSVMTLTPQDADAVARECPAVVGVAPVVRARCQVVYGNRNWVPMYIQGSTPDFLRIRDWEDMAQGSPFTDHDVRNTAAVCVLGQTVAQNLFGDESPVGKDVRMQNVSFRVLGVLSRKGANTFGMDQDDLVLAPWTTIKYRVSASSLTNVNQSSSAAAAASSADTSTQVNTLTNLYPTVVTTLYPTPSPTETADTPQPIRFTNVDQIMCQAETPQSIQPAIDQITALLHERHHIQAGQPDDFSIRDMTETSQALLDITTRMSIFLVFVAGISLVVGGVGIMNIMLVSVTERTREIGLRMAVGARPAAILWQFMIEAVMLCSFGGAIGILAGRGFSVLLRYYQHLPTEISLVAIFLAVVVSVTVGLVFGYYPAWKASRLDPIDALRYE